MIWGDAKKKDRKKREEQIGVEAEVIISSWDWSARQVNGIIWWKRWRIDEY